jgi:hypothetical protein
MPALILACTIGVGYIFRDKLMNILNLERLSPTEEKFVSRKIATLIKYQHYQNVIQDDMIEQELVELVYSSL